MVLYHRLIEKKGKEGGKEGPGMQGERGRGRRKTSVYPYAGLTLDVYIVFLKRN